MQRKIIKIITNFYKIIYLLKYSKIKNIIKQIENKSKIKIKKIKKLNKQKFFNDVFEINNKYILILCNKTTNKCSIESTITILNHIQNSKELKTKTPNIIFSDINYKQPFYMYKKIKGFDAHCVYDDLFMEKHISKKIAEELGGFLKKLHSIKININKILNKQKILQKTIISNKKNINKIYQLLTQKEKYILKQCIINTFKTNSKNILHGDIHRGNIIINKKHQVTGVIDFDLSGIGSPFSDLSSIYKKFGKSFFNYFLTKYTNKSKKYMFKKTNEANIVNSLIELINLMNKKNINKIYYKWYSEGYYLKKLKSDINQLSTI